MISLGLDIGSSSVGWALVDEAGQEIIAVGTRIFPEGVDRDQKGGEKSKNQARRIARGMRRQIRRRARRKCRLRDLLAQNGLLPTSANDLDKLLDQNPYNLRRRALSEQLSLHQIGRTILHLNQRRGFRPSRKTDSRSSEAKGMLKEIDDLRLAIEETGCRTLGQYLAQLNPPDGAGAVSRIRGRHTRRDMYRHELEEIWKEQASYHPELTDPLRDQIVDVIFFQRDIYWPRSVVGRCELERNQRRCPKSDRMAQRFRMLQEVNNLRLLDRGTGEERKLSDEERAKLLGYLATSEKRTFKQIRKKLGLIDSVQFNFERGERDKLDGHITDAKLNRALKPDWSKFDDAKKDQIVAVLIEEDQEERALHRLLEECNLSPEQAQKALGVHLPDGYMSFCRTVIVKLLLHLERGLALMGNDASDSALHAAGYLRPDERVVSQREYLPPIPDLPNPIVRQALVEVRKVVNAAIREYGKPSEIHVELAREAKKSFDQRQEIRFENARRRKEREYAKAEIEKRGLKPTRARINRYSLWQEQNNDCPYCGWKISQSQLFDEGVVDVDHILPRWRSLDDSLGNKVVAHRACNDKKRDRTPREWLEKEDPAQYERMLQVIKLLPYGKQLKFQQKDIKLDEFVNRQLTDTAYISRCVKQYLQCLGKPVHCHRGQITADLRHWWGLNVLDPDGEGKKNRDDHRHHAIDAVIMALTNAKRLYNSANARGKDVPPPWPELHRQLKEMLDKSVVSHRSVRRLSGSLHEDTFYGATQKGNGGRKREERPWAKDWIEQSDTYVRRKPVTELKNTKHLEKVRDNTIREILKAHLRVQGIDPEKPGAIPSEAFKGTNTPKLPSGTRIRQMRRLHGDEWVKELQKMPSTVSIRRVRMIEQSDTFRPVSTRRQYQNVKPGNNHHIAYWEKQTESGVTWEAEVVPMWDAAKRGRAGLPMVDRTPREGSRFLFSLCQGDSFLMDGPDGKPQLCIVQKIDQRAKRINYFLHHDARPKDEINKDNLYLSAKRMQEVGAKKVTVDPLGRIRWAND